MTSSSDPIETLRLLSATTRKQVLILMVAINDHDEDLALIAATRVRDALRLGERIVSTIVDEPERRAAIGILETTRHSAAPWLKRAPAHVDGMLDARRLIDRFGGSTPSLAPLESRDAVVDIDLNGAEVADLDISDLAVQGLRAHGSALTRATATGSRMSWCEFIASSLPGARFDASTIDACTFERSNLERTSWASARITRTSFAGAMLIDSRFDNTVVTDCDLRGADLGIVNSTLRDGPVRTMFVRCDLRESNWSNRSVAGAHFFECKLFGVHGTPFATEGLEIVRPDLSFQGMARASVRRKTCADCGRSSRSGFATTPISKSTVESVRWSSVRSSQ